MSGGEKTRICEDIFVLFLYGPLVYRICWCAFVFVLFFVFPVSCACFFCVVLFVRFDGLLVFELFEWLIYAPVLFCLNISVLYISFGCSFCFV